MNLNLNFNLNVLSRWFSGESRPCPLCGQPCGGGDGRRIPIRHPEARKPLQALCRACLSSIPWIAHPLCRTCGRGDPCEDCARRTMRYYAACRCAARYDEAMKEWLARYKYRGHEGLAPVMAAMLAFAYERLTDALAPAPGHAPYFHAITSVPLSADRERERGFNQAERMARHLAEWYGIPYRSMLRRVRHTEKQSLKSRRSRVTDMRGIFARAELEFHSTPPETSNLLLVDDVYTTGSTMNECARVLIEGESNVRVYGLAWAR